MKEISLFAQGPSAEIEKLKAAAQSLGLERLLISASREHLDAAHHNNYFYSDYQTTIDPLKKEVTVRGTKVSFTPVEYAIFSFLVYNQDSVHAANDLYAKAIREEREYVPNTGKWYILQIRRKIEQDPKDPKLIVTQPGFGYKYERPNARSA